MARHLVLWRMNSAAPWPTDPSEGIKLNEMMWMAIDSFKQEGLLEEFGFFPDGTTGYVKAHRALFPMQREFESKHLHIAMKTLFMKRLFRHLPLTLQWFSVIRGVNRGGDSASRRTVREELRLV